MITVCLWLAELSALLRALEDAVRLAALPDILLCLQGRLAGLLALAPMASEDWKVSNDTPCCVT